MGARCRYEVNGVIVTEPRIMTPRPEDPRPLREVRRETRNGRRFRDARLMPGLRDMPDDSRPRRPKPPARRPGSAPNLFGPRGLTLMASAKRGHASPACFLRSGYHAGRLSVLATSRPATGAKVSGGYAAAPGCSERAKARHAIA